MEIETVVQETTYTDENPISDEIVENVPQEENTFEDMEQNVSDEVLQETLEEIETETEMETSQILEESLDSEHEIVVYQETIDYSEQLQLINDNLNLGFMFSVFFIGVMCGAILGKMLWERVRI